MLGWSSFENSSSLGLPEYESVCRRGGKGKWYILAGHVLFTSPQNSFLSYYYIISHCFNASERIYTEYGKDLLQSTHMSRSHVAGNGGVPSGAARQDCTGQGWSHHRSQKQGRMGGMAGS